MNYRFEFTSTIQDLLHAEGAQRSLTLPGTTLRWIMGALGCGFLAVGGVVYGYQKLLFQPLVWGCIGLVLLYLAFIKSILRRSRIRKNNAPQKHVALEFSDDSLAVLIEGVGHFRREWKDLDAFAAADDGILFYFRDGIINWLPDRTFADQDERRQFIEFLGAHQIREQGRRRGRHHGKNDMPRY